MAFNKHTFRCPTSLLLLLVLTGWCHFSFAGTMEFNPGMSDQEVGPYLTFVEDPHHQLTVQQVDELNRQHRLEEPDSIIPNYGDTRSTYWFNFALLNNHLEEHVAIFNFPFPFVDELEVFFLSEDGEIKSHFLTGDTYLFSQRPFLLNTFSFPVELASHSTTQVYFRIKTTSTLSVPASVSSVKGFVEEQSVNQWFAGLFYGITIALMLYNLFLFLFTRDRSFLYYVLHTLFGIFYYTVIDGYGFVLFPSGITWNAYAVYVYSLLSLLFGLLFAGAFLDLHNGHKTPCRILQGLALLTLAMLILLPFESAYIASMSVRTLGLLIIIFLISVGVLRLKQGYQPAKYYLLAWTGFLLSTFFTIMAAWGLIANFAVATIGMKVSMVFELVMLSIAIASRINNTEKEQREQKNATITALAESRTKSELLAKLSHEIRTPLVGMLSTVKGLSEQQLPINQQRHVNAISASGRAMLGVLDEVLDYSRMKSGKLKLSHSEFDLEQLLNDCCAIFEEKAKTQHIEFVCHIDSDIPRLLIGDAVKIRQIIINLLSNAFKFTHQGSVGVRVKALRGANKHITVQFEIVDTGQGINTFNQQKLFQTVSQLQEQDDGRAGMGLGLAISKELCELMGGSIDFHSNEGQGSRFSFALPLTMSDSMKRYPCVGDSGLWGFVGFSATFAKMIRDELPLRGVSVSILELNERGELLQNLDQPQAYSAIFLPQQSVKGNVGDIEKQLLESGVDSSLLVLCLTPVADDQALVADTEVGHVMENCFSSQQFFSTVQSLGILKAEEDLNKPGTDQIESLSSGLTVLVAEDDGINRLVLCKFLKKLGHDTVAVANGDEAVAAYRSHAVDIIIMDCEMPVLSGLEAAEQIREGEMISGGERKPIVALSGRVDLQAQQRCLEVGMDDYMVKPITIERLKEVIDRYRP